jgi:thymidylate synthase
VEAKIHSSGVTRQAVTQQRREVEAKINQVEAALEALRASNDDRTSHSKKWPAEVSDSCLEVVPLAIHLVSKLPWLNFVT